ncbi:hypothetical protein LCGC14_0354680 [marine sediment metagenome]|uniref:Uncharacterized protein n=1 Tax=marine sediment metagenome TaxID=412755 RepID=A0A0F9TSV6_9ZZZZ
MRIALRRNKMNATLELLETWIERFIANRELDGAKLSERADPFLRGDDVRWIIWEIQKMECEIDELIRRTDERA